jgi:hypothetical protein
MPTDKRLTRLTFSLFSKDNHLELQHLTGFLGSLHNALWGLFNNGRSRSLVGPGRYSISEMRKQPKIGRFNTRPVQVDITPEVEMFLKLAARKGPN